MSSTTISPAKLSSMIVAGANNLNSNKEYINDLNVFPVPDGDTGTNMSLTIMSAADLISSKGSMDMADLSKCVSQGSLRGARGNSGVILSQLLRGFCKVISEYRELDSRIIATACVKGVETAYKAVMRPKEGTILTVARGISEKASELCDNTPDLNTFFEKVLLHGNKVLSQTPEMLPVLKEAGVVDAGGQGLLEFLKGAVNEFNNVSTATATVVTSKPVLNSTNDTSRVVEADIKFCYCTEFIINLMREFSEKDEADFKAFLSGIGDSIVCVSLDEIVKVHVHTNDPGVAISRALTYGELTNLKIDNMREEHRERLFNSGEKEENNYTSPTEDASVNLNAKEKPVFDKKFGFISVSAGQGLSDLFTALGCDHLIEGGQTMNPSTNDILNAISCVNAENIFILPNNKNIILAANQAAELTTDRNVIVIPSTTIPQGITAMLNFDPDSGLDANRENLNEAITTVRTGQVTYSVRDTTIEDRRINKDDFMGISDSGIVSNGTDIVKVVLETLDKIYEDASIISVYYGSDVNEEAALSLEQVIAEKYKDCELSVVSGGQPVYYYIISVE